VPSLGYVVWERRRKLKQEYRNLEGRQIRDLRLSGVEVAEEIRQPLVAYAGDTSPPGLDECPAMYLAKILICEMTFVSPDHRKAKIHKFGHMHLDDFVERRDLFQNELIIASHFSTRYHPGAVERMVRRRLPDMLDDRLMLWM
jgi:ribonuclease Z